MNACEIKTYQFLLKDFNRTLKPFKLYSSFVYYIGHRDLDLNSSQEIKLSFDKKRYDLILWPSKSNVQIEDLTLVYKYFNPSGKLNFSKNLMPNQQTPFDLEEALGIDNIKLLFEYLGIEDNPDNLFIYIDSNTLYVTFFRNEKNLSIEEMLNEVLEIIPVFSDDTLYFNIDFEDDDEYYLNIDEDSKKAINSIIQKFRELNKSGQFLSILPYIEKQINNIKGDVELSYLYIDKDYRIFLKDYNNQEIKMSHLSKSLYFLFLMNPPIYLEDILKFENELLAIYRHISNQENFDKMKASITQLLKNNNNELYVHFSRIKSAFCKVIDENIAKHYYIKGAKLKPKGIDLNRKLTNIDLFQIDF